MILNYFDGEFSKSARKELARAFSPSQIEVILKDTDIEYKELLKALPKVETIGARTSLRLSAFSVALYRTLGERRISEQASADLVGEAVYGVVRKFHAPMEKLVWMLRSDPIGRAELKSHLTQLLFYSAPDYMMNDIPFEDGYGLDVHRCPVADYFRGLGLGHLCERVMCDQDYKLGGGKSLRRTGTLARGAVLCDFRYYLVNPRTELTP